MKRTSILIAALLALHAVPAAAQEFDEASLRRAGLDPAKMAELPRRFREFVEQQQLSGAVLLVSRRGQAAGPLALGFQDAETRAPMKADTIFRIASMTKPITAVAIMMLEDEGKLSTDDPVEKHLPEFRGQMLVREKSGGVVTLVKPPRPITLCDLLTHTSGLPGSPPPGLGNLYSKRHRTLAEAVMAYSQRPLDFEPGSKWSYCNTGVDTLGRVVEAVSGTPYESFLDERIFRPLGMTDTFFYVPAGKVARLTPIYTADKEKLKKVDSFLGDPLEGEGRYPIPAGGLYSTASDLARLYQMMLDRGTRGEKRLVSEASVGKMTRLHTGDLTCGFTKAMGFGLGWAVVKEPVGVTGMLSAGSYGHGGAFGTQGWIDPGKGMFFVLMIQRAGLRNGDESEFRKTLQSVAVSAVTD